MAPLANVFFFVFFLSVHFGIHRRVRFVAFLEERHLQTYPFILISQMRAQVLKSC